MKIKENLKKIGISSLALIAGVSSIHADTTDYGSSGAVSTVQDLADSMQNSFMNVTPGNTTTNPDGSTSYTTTSLYFKFGPAFETYEPIYHISPLAISAGCGGFSIKGMFMSLLGIDRIQEMLKSSATSFAYGIVVGLVYTLPGIFHSFQMLNQWAKKIQELMNNACKAGEAIGRSLSDNYLGITAASEQIKGYVDKLTSPEGIIGSLDTAANSFVKSLGLDINSLSGSSDPDEVRQPTEVDELPWEDVEELLSLAISSVRVFTSTTTTVLYTIMVGVGNNVDGANNLDHFLAKALGVPSLKNMAVDTDSNIKEGYFALTYNYNATGYNINGVNSIIYSIPKFLNEISSLDTAQVYNFFTLTKLAIQKSLIGDIVANDGFDLESFMTMFRGVVAKAKNGDFANSTEEEQAKREIKDYINGRSKLFAIVPEETISDPEKLGAGIAQLMIGDSKMPNGVSGSFGYLKKHVAPLGILVTAWPGLRTGGNKETSVSLFPLSATKTRQAIGAQSFFQEVNLPQKSLYDSSYEIADAMINRDGRTTNEIVTDASKDLGTGNINNLPLIEKIVPNFYVFAKIAQESMPIDREAAIKKLAQYNTCMIAMTALDIFQSASTQGAGKIGYALSFTDSGGVKLSKYKAPVKQADLNTMTSFITQPKKNIWEKFYKGFKAELLKIIEAQAFTDNAPDRTFEQVCNKDSLESWFTRLDVKNRHRAAANVDSKK